jgi:hypothetical protein
MTRPVAAALIHYPVLDRDKNVVTSAITNIDLHDLARSAHTFDLCHVFVVHPVTAQRTLAERVRAHWVDGSGARRIPDRTPAMRKLVIVESLDAALAALGEGGEVELWTTSAAAQSRAALTYSEARSRLEASGPPVLLAFGTGWGLAPTVVERAVVQLAPIASKRADGYNHLSVRAAAAITFDRLFGSR